MDFVEKEVSYLVDYLNQNKRDLSDFDYQLKSNGGLVYVMPDKKVILLPANVSLEENGLLIKNEEVLNEIIKNDFFPISVNESEFLEKHKERLEKLPENVDYYLSSLEEKLGINISQIENFDDSFFESFDTAIHNCNLNDRKEEFLMPLSILLGEIIKKKKNGYWKTVKEYSLYNPYYQPYIVMNGVDLNVTERIISDLDNPKYFSLKQSYLFLTDERLNPMLNPNIKDIYNSYLDNGTD